jgi:hypothetical protein
MYSSQMSISPPPNTPERRSSGIDISSSRAAAALCDEVDIVTPKKNDDSDDGCGNDCGSVNSEEEDLSEIKDLQRALEYLISDKRQCSINNNELEKHDNLLGADAEDVTLCQIPNLVNRILMEHYSPRQPSQTHKAWGDIQYSTREKMTQLLIAVIVEFAEPYFVNIARHREEGRKKQTHEKGQEPQQKKKKVEKEDNNVSSKYGFEDRAVSWATQCLKLLLQPNLSSFKQKDNNSEAKAVDDLHIPELDALLAATGLNDGYEMEKRMQQALLLGVKARSMFVSSCIAGWHSERS